MALAYKGTIEQVAGLAELLNREDIKFSWKADGRLRIESDRQEVIRPLIKEAQALIESHRALQEMLGSFLKNEAKLRKLQAHQRRRHCIFTDAEMVAEWLEHPDRGRIAIEHDEDLKRMPGASFFLQAPESIPKRTRDIWRVRLVQHIRDNHDFADEARLLLSAELRDPGRENCIGVWTCSSRRALQLTVSALETYHPTYLETKGWDKGRLFAIDIATGDLPGVVRNVEEHYWLIPNGIRIAFERGASGWHATTAFPVVYN